METLEEIESALQRLVALGLVVEVEDGVMAAPNIVIVDAVDFE